MTVVGAGIVGLATAAVLADAGVDVHCLDLGEPMGARSAGGTRVFRLAHGDAGLVEAAGRARTDWDAWSARAGRTLVGDEGTVVSGPRAPAWAAAMAEAGAAHELTGTGSRDLPGPVAGPVLRDPGGGVLDLRATAAFLTGIVRPERRRVLSLGADGTLTCEDSTERADAVVVAAGAGTAELVAPLGVELPGTLEHHARFAFRPRRDLGAAPCHLDGTGSPDGTGVLASTYQHLTCDGLWAVGGHLPDTDTEYALGADEVARRSRAAVVAHVAEHLPALDPEPVEELRCVPHRGLGDGVHRARAGAVHVVWGDNLAKLAPWIGRTLAEGVLARS